jgi:hypothetical protein
MLKEKVEILQMENISEGSIMKNILRFTRKKTLLFFGLFILNGALLTCFGSHLKVYTDMPKLDFLIHGYTKETITALWQAYGPEGKADYFWLTILDMPFPFLLFLFASGLGLRTLLERGHSILFRLFFGSALTFLIFDLVENISVFFFLYMPVDMIPDIWIHMTSLATQIKLYALFIVYGTFFILAMVSLFIFVKRKVGKKPMATG